MVGSHAVPSLPDDVLVHILLRLPARSIGQFRAVCKAWRAATTLPSFDRARAARSAAVAKVNFTCSVLRFPLVVRLEIFGGRWPWPLGDDDRREGGSFARAVAVSRPRFSACRVLGSLDGVICFQTYTVIDLRAHPGEEHHRDDGTVLWNPLTNALATVSVPAGEGRIVGGYAHPVTGRFHLLHRRGLLAPIAFHILRVGDNNHWREVPFANKLNVSMKSHDDRPVILHGVLHWLVQSAATGKVMILMFDTANEEFRFMEGPEPKRPGRLVLQATRTVLSHGKLGMLTLASAPPTGSLEMWVLDDHSDQQTWRLKEKIRLVRLNDGTDLSARFTCPITKVELVEDEDDGMESWEDQIDAYNVQDKVWRRVNVTKRASVVMHRESVLQPEVSFGEEARLVRP